jgi:hypothetical protein
VHPEGRCVERGWRPRSCLTKCSLTDALTLNSCVLLVWQERKICFGDFGIVDRDHHDHNDLTALREELEGTRYRLSRLLRAKNEEVMH